MSNFVTSDLGDPVNTVGAGLSLPIFGILMVKLVTYFADSHFSSRYIVRHFFLKKKNISLISPKKHMLWVLIRKTSVRHF